METTPAVARPTTTPDLTEAIETLAVLMTGRYDTELADSTWADLGPHAYEAYREEAKEVVDVVAPLIGKAVREQTAQLDYAMFTVWLCGNWRFLTSQMITPAKEAAADAVERHWAAMDAEDGEQDHSPETRAELRWWR